MKGKVNDIFRMVIGIRDQNRFPENIVKGNTLQIQNAKNVENELISGFHLPLSESRVDTKIRSSGNHDITEEDGRIIR